MFLARSPAFHLLFKIKYLLMDIVTSRPHLTEVTHYLVEILTTQAIAVTITEVVAEAGVTGFNSKIRILIGEGMDNSR